MKDFQVTKTFSGFTKKEMKLFEKFVNSPFFNTSKATVKLFYAINDFYPEFKTENISREVLFGRIYPNRKFNPVLFNRLSSNLIALQENFIEQCSRQFQPYRRLNGLRRKKLNNRFLSYYKKTTGKKLNMFTDDDVLLSQLVYDELIEFLDSTGEYGKAEKYKPASFELTLIFFLYRLAINYPRKRTFSSGALPGENAAGIVLNCIDPEKLYKEISGSQLKNKKHLMHLLQLILLERSGNEELFNTVRDDLLNNASVYGTSSMYTGFVYLLDFCTREISAGKEKYYAERFKIYKAIEKGYFANGRLEMHISLYRNFIVSAVINSEINWAEYVLKRYRDTVESREFGIVVKYLEALILFSAGKFELSLEMLSVCDKYRLSRQKKLFSHDLRILKIRVFYELGHFEQALSLIGSAMHLIDKSEFIILHNKSSHKNFLKYIKALINLRQDNDKNGIIKLLKNLANEKTYERKWLEKKCRELC